MLYRIHYRVTERSTFQAYVEAEDEAGALQELHTLARDQGGDYANVGAWISTEGTDVDVDSFTVEPGGPDG